MSRSSTRKARRGLARATRQKLHAQLVELGKSHRKLRARLKLIEGENALLRESEGHAKALLERTKREHRELIYDRHCIVGAFPGTTDRIPVIFETRDGLQSTPSQMPFQIYRGMHIKRPVRSAPMFCPKDLDLSRMEIRTYIVENLKYDQDRRRFWIAVETNN